MSNKTNLNIVFIYLGNTVPRYVLLNFYRVSKLFQYPVYLFIEKDTWLPDVDFELDNDFIIRLEKRNFKADFSLDHDESFRNGFWFLTFERLLMLKEIHSIIGSENRLLHLEGDMLLMKSFPFESNLGGKLKWFRHDENSDVASIVYSPTLADTEWLFEELIQEARRDPQTTDMKALNQIRKSHDERVEVFSDIQKLFETGESADIFDGLALGQWIGGMDPRNTYGLRVVHENGNFEVAKSFTFREAIKNFEISMDKNSIMIIDCNGRRSTIHSLHIHCKDESLFQLENSSELSALNSLGVEPIPIVIGVDFRMLRNLLWSNFRAGTLLPYVLGLVRFARKRDFDQEDSRFRAFLKYVTSANPLRHK